MPLSVGWAPEGRATLLESTPAWIYSLPLLMMCPIHGPAIPVMTSANCWSWILSQCFAAQRDVPIWQPLIDQKMCFQGLPQTQALDPFTDTSIYWSGWMKLLMMPREGSLAGPFAPPPMPASNQTARTMPYIELPLIKCEIIRKQIHR